MSAANGSPGETERVALIRDLQTAEARLLEAQAEARRAEGERRAQEQRHAEEQRPHRSWIQESRKHWGRRYRPEDVPSDQEIAIGALQRIARALESIATTLDPEVRRRRREAAARREADLRSDESAAPWRAAECRASLVLLARLVEGREVPGRYRSGLRATFAVVIRECWPVYREAWEASCQDAADLWPPPPGDLARQAEAWAQSLDLTSLAWESYTYSRRGTLRWLREQLPLVKGSAP